MKFLYAVLAIMLSYSTIYAQTEGYEITPIKGNYKLNTFKAKITQRSAPDSIDLPFIEDFSYDGPYPDSDLWLDNQVFINNTMGQNPPSVGVATFDAIDAKGRPYGSVGGVGGADTLTSNYINLKDFVGTDGNKRNLTVSDNILMSFFLQPKGNNYAPVEGDSMVLEFKDASGTWNYVKGYKGIPDSTLKKSSLDTEFPFVYYTVPINDAKYLFGKFQFRFYNITRLGGAYEFWHLDYIKIAPNRLVSNRNLDDLAFVETPKSILKRYTAMPWNHAFPQLAAEVKDSLNAKFYNTFTLQRNPTNTNVKVSSSTGVTAVNNYTILDGVNIPASTFYTSIAKVYPSSLKLQLANIPAATSNMVLKTEYSLTIEGQEGKDLKKAGVRNDIVSDSTHFSNYFAYDDGTAEMQFSATGENMQVAVRFRANVADSLQAVRFLFPHINGDAPKDATFNIRIWTGVLQGKPLYELKGVKPYYLTTSTDTLQGFTGYQLADTSGKAIPIPAGDFYVCWQNVGDVKIPIGLDRNNKDKTQYLYQYLNGVWESVANTRNIGAVMVRPVMGTTKVKNSTRISELPLSDVMMVSPNPASDHLFFEIKKGQSEDYEISLFNIAGQLQKREILRGSVMSLDNMSAGIYFLKVKDLKNNQIFNHKFVVSH